ncbi:cytosolic carboxypeptidase 3 isoform X5 [Eretmochelys imbricata]
MFTFLKIMSEDSDKDKQLINRIISDEYNSDEDPFNPFVAEDLEQCAFFTDSICDQLFPRTKQIVLAYNSGRWVPRLREPRNLYGISPARHLSLIRWPHQCEVIRDRIEHIDWIPHEPEPLYHPTGLELEPLFQYPREDTVVYLADEANEESCFVYSRVGGSYPSKQVIAQDWDNTLIFEARFESGNLQKVVKVVMEERDILLYCDLHGHSRKENVFMYGCDGGEQVEVPCLHQRIFPLMMSKNCPDKFSFPDCNFKVQKSKEGTGRVVMWKMGIRNSYTLEATFCGSKLGNRGGTHFHTEDLESIGYHFCDALLDYCDPDKSKYYLCLKELEEMVKQEVKTNSENLNCDSDASVTDAMLDKDSSTHVSDSSDSSDTTAHWLKPDTQVKSKKKCMKTKKERNSYLVTLEKNHTNYTQEQVRKAKPSEENFHSITKNRGNGSKNVSVCLPFSSRSNDVTKVQTSSMALHKILKEIDPMVKEAIPVTEANYTEQYLSPYFPEQGSDLDWTTVSQPLKHFISQRLFLPPAILKQMCYIGATAGNGAISGCQLPKVVNRPKVKEKKAQRRVKLPVTASIKQVGKCFSSERLTQGAQDNILENNCLPLGLGESMSQDATLPKRTNLSSPFIRMTSRSVEKHQGKRVTSCTEKTVTYLDHSAKSSSNREERKVKRPPLKSARSGQIRTTNQEANVRMIKSCQTQESLQLSLPIVPSAKGRQSNEKCHEGEPQPKAFGQHRADLATCSNMKGNMARPTLSSKMILLAQHDNRETFRPDSLLCAIKKTSAKGLLCNIETKAMAKRKALEPGSQTLLTRPSSRNWVNFLSGLEIDANVVKNGTLQAKIYSQPGSIQTGH